MASAGAKLRGLYRGRFRGIKVISRGASPRIVQADVIGTAGRTRVSGATLRAELGLYDTWAYFQSIKTGKAPKPQPPGPVDPATPMVARVPAVAGLRGTVFPAKRGATLRVERRFHGRWIPAGETKVGSAGRYHAGVSAPGLYRVRFQGHTGPGVTIR
jgi:stage II sporulation protein D